MIKRLLIAVVVLGLVVGGIVWFKFFRDGMIAQILGNIVPAPVAVNTEEVQPINWTPKVEAIGTALSKQGVDLAIESGGLVREIRFTANDAVPQNQPLLQIDDDSERAALAAAEATLNVAISDAERAATLKDRGVGAATTVESSQAEVERARAEAARLQTAVDQKSLTAPFDGVIGIPKVELGQYVAPGQVYATLQDLSRINVDFSVPEQQIKALQLGGTVRVFSDNDGFSGEGHIIGIEPRVDPVTRMISVRAEIANPGGQVFPGQFLRVHVNLPEQQGVLAVSQTAISSTLYGDTIFVLRDGATAEEKTAQTVFVKLGRRTDTRIEVLEGLKAGDLIVTSGQNRLTSGARVVIDNSVDLSTQTVQE